MFTQQLMNALAIGSVYALTAMGATLIYGILGILDVGNHDKTPLGEGLPCSSCNREGAKLID